MTALINQQVAATIGPAFKFYHIGLKTLHGSQQFLYHPIVNRVRLGHVVEFAEN